MVNIRDRKSKVFPAGEPRLNWTRLAASFHRYALKRPMALIEFASGRSGLMMLDLAILSNWKRTKFLIRFAQDVSCSLTVSTKLDIPPEVTLSNEANLEGYCVTEVTVQ